MFEFLKKKIDSFKEKFTQKVEETPAEETKEIQKPIEEKKTQETLQKEISETYPEPVKEEIIQEKPKEFIEEKKEINQEPDYDFAGEKKTAEEVLEKETEKRELKAKVSLGKKITGFFTGKIKLTEKDLTELLFELELSLLEADVQQETATEIIEELKKEVEGKEIKKGTETDFLKESIKIVLEKIMNTEEIDFNKMLEEKKPLKILFLGPNGVGKTTSIAKLTKSIQRKGKTVLLASGDTFRAGSIEQLEEHAKKLEVKVIKHNYGADPAAVAFDAVKSAEAKGINAVLIDSAGRQNTNKNLLEELKKIDRVIKPDLKLYVGEAFTGQALVQQAKEFNEKISIDGFILTKIDSDTKGGTAISLLHQIKKPILFIGTGQRYEDLTEFHPKYIINRII
ncbi:MAG: signal recognition particle-docking protein FtsY [Candidatus Diapherotrites archaeon]|nr:signal recognition particle-docking protein FtsY [Candidatus Diapherotrites archaeon]